MEDKKPIEQSKAPKVIAAVITLLLIWFIVSLFTGRNDENSATEINQTSEVVASDSEEHKLSAKVDEHYRDAWGIDSYNEFLLSEDYPDGSLVGYINRFEDVSDDTIRVYVQTDASEEEAEGLAKNILATVGFDIEELDWVVVRGTDGRDYQASRNDIPALR